MNKAVYPGSFDPITFGHLDILKQASEVFDHVTILIAINPGKTPRFSIDQRISMIKDSITEYNNVDVDFTPGLTVEYANKVGANTLIRGLRNDVDSVYEMNLVNEYKKTNPNINIRFFKTDKELANISSSLVEQMVSKKQDISKFVPKAVVEMYKKR